jgi:tRNA(fMet)-specific endonuclease VapC
MSYMLDTDVCIYLLTDRAPEKRAHILSRQPDPPLLLSAVTVSELSYGVEKSKWRKANTALLDKFLRDFHIVPYDERAARICGVLRATLEKKGYPIGPMDTLIAAHAVSMDATLITHNTREFARASNLAIEDWTLPP